MWFPPLANCPACPLRDFPKVPPTGNLHADICILGEGPGFVEESRGEPFVGPSGRLLNEILGAAGLRRDDMYVTNAGICLPRELVLNGADGEAVYYTQGRARDISIDCCAPRLHDELQRVSPKVIVALGAKGYKQVTGLTGMAKYHGSVVTSELTNGATPYVIPLYHPAFLLRGKNQYYVSLIDGFKKARRLSRGEHQPPCEFQFISPQETDLETRVAWFEDLVDDVLVTGEDFAVDVEATGKNPRAATLTIVGFGFMHRRLGVSVGLLVQDFDTKQYLNHWAGLPALWQRVFATLRKLLASRNTKWYHNLGYDVTALERYFVLGGKVADTIILHHLYQPDLPHDLGWVAMQLLDIEPWKAFFRDKQRKGKTKFVEEMAYNCRDALYTGLCVEPLVKEVGARSNLHLVEHQLKVAELARGANKTGIPIHLPTWYEMRQKHAAARDEALAAIKASIGAVEGSVSSLNDYVLRKRKGAAPKKVLPALTLEDFNPLSPNHARWFLYEHLGLEPIRFTKGGADRNEAKVETSYSAKGVVEYMANPIVKEFVRFAEERAFVSTLDTLFSHADPIKGNKPLWDVLERHRVDDVIPVNGVVLAAIEGAIRRGTRNLIVRLHPSWNTTGQKGTRWAARPAAQNWEKDLRKMARLPKGRKWVAADAQALEYRIAACLAGIQELLDIFNKEPFSEETEPWKKFDPAFDAHSLLAAEVYGDDYTKAVERCVREAWECEVVDPLGAACLVPDGVAKRDVKYWEFFAALGVGCEAVAKGRKIQSQLRTFVKRVVYALFYGATPEKIYATLMEDKKLPREMRAKISFNRVADIVAGFERRFPEWSRWVDRETVRVKSTHGYQVIPPLGRRRWYPLAWKVEATKIRNAPIQISAGDIVNKMFVEMDRRIKEENLDSHFAVHGHDACYWDTAEQDVPRVIEIVNEVFDVWLESPQGHRVRIYGRAHAADDLAAAA